METIKVSEDGRVYAMHSFDGGVVVEKSDPVVMHNAPQSVVVGETVTITFELRDFDGAIRTDSEGTLLLMISDAQVPLAVSGGRASLTIELHAGVDIGQLPPFPDDARMATFRIEVSQ